MAFLQEVHQLMNAVTLSGQSGDNVYTTGALDLRDRITRINSVLVVGTSATGAPSFVLAYQPGVTCAEFQSNIASLFGPSVTLLTSPSAETLQIVEMPAPLSPFVRFTLTSKNGSPADSLYSLWALCQVRF